jgi:hypothetical protein
MLPSGIRAGRTISGDPRTVPKWGERKDGSMPELADGTFHGAGCWPREGQKGKALMPYDLDNSHRNIFTDHKTEKSYSALRRSIMERNRVSVFDDPVVRERVAELISLAMRTSPTLGAGCAR